MPTLAALSLNNRPDRAKIVIEHQRLVNNMDSLPKYCLKYTIYNNFILMSSVNLDAGL